MAVTTETTNPRNAYAPPEEAPLKRIVHDTLLERRMEREEPGWKANMAEQRKLREHHILRVTKVTTDEAGVHVYMGGVGTVDLPRDGTTERLKQGDELYLKQKEQGRVDLNTTDEVRLVLSRGDHQRDEDGFYQEIGTNKPISTLRTVSPNLLPKTGAES